MQQQVTSRISAEVQWNKRWFYGYYVSRNLALDPAADWNAYNITAPVDSRLPGGGGYTISGLHDVVPAKFGQANFQIQGAGQLRRPVPVLERRRPDAWRCARRKGLTFQGGTSTGQTVQDLCSVSNQLPDALLAPQALAVGVSTSRASRRSTAFSPAWRQGSTAISRRAS